MTDWITVALSGGSVCLGAGLTMLGQYFADRRSQIRDREARREGFRITNYEIQRDSLHELQEIMLKLDRAISKISESSKWHDRLAAIASDGFPVKLPKPTEWYQIQPIGLRGAELIAEGGKIWEEQKQMGIPPDRKLKIAARAKEIADELKAIADQIKPDSEAHGELVELSTRVKVLAARSGDDLVFAACGDLIQALNTRVSAKGSEEGERRNRDARKQINLTLDTINNALRKGPLS